MGLRKPVEIVEGPEGSTPCVRFSKTQVTRSLLILYNLGRIQHFHSSYEFDI